MNSIDELKEIAKEIVEEIVNQNCNKSTTWIYIIIV